MATIVKTTLLNDGDEVLVKGTKGRQTVLYIDRWNEYQRRLGVVGAEKDFDRSVEEFFAPLDEDELRPIGYCCADWWRDMAFRVAAQTGEGRA